MERLLAFVFVSAMSRVLSFSQYLAVYASPGFSKYIVSVIFILAASNAFSQPGVVTQPADYSTCQPNSGTTYNLTPFVVSPCNSTKDVTFEWEYNNGGTWQTVTSNRPVGFTAYSTVAAKVGANFSSSLSITLNASANVGTVQFRGIARADKCNSGGVTTISRTVNFTVNPKPVPAFSTQPGATGCTNTEYTYTTQPGQTGYLWTVPGTSGLDYAVTAGSLTSNTITLRWISSGSKIVKVNYTNATGCTAVLPTESTATNIAVPPTPTFTAQAGPSICSDTDITYTTQPTFSNYAWTIPGTSGVDYIISAGGTSTSNTVTLKWLTSGNKSVSVNYSNLSSCSGTSPATASTSVTARPVPAFTSGPGATTCVLTNVTYTTLLGGTNYVWNIPGTLDTDYKIISGAATGTSNTVTLQWITTGSKTVTVNYTNPDGCSGAAAASSQTVVSSQAVPVITAGGSLAFCSGGSVSLIASGAASYQWYNGGILIPGATNQTYTATIAGTYTVQVASAAGCEAASAGTEVVVYPIPDITVSSQAGSLCFSSSSQATQLDYIATVGLPVSYSIAWDATAIAANFLNVNNAALPTGSIPITVPANATGNTIFSGTLTVSNAGGCVSSSKLFTVSITSPPDISDFGITAAQGCQGTGSVITVSSTSIADGSYTVTYNLSGNNTASGKTAIMNFTGNSGTFLAAALIAGPTDITITQIALVGCATPVNANNTASITINNLPQAPVFTLPPGLCVNSAISIGMPTPGGIWSSSEPSIASVSSDGIVTGVFPGTVMITYTTAPDGATGCTSSTSQSLDILALPVVGQITGQKALCINSTSVLQNATTGGTWSSSDPAVATIDQNGVITTLSIGTTTILYVTPVINGCTNSISTLVTVESLPTVMAGAGLNACQSPAPAAILLSGAGFGGSASSATWSILEGKGTLSNENATTNPASVTFTPAANFSGTVTLLLTSNASNSCEPATQVRTIVITERPLVAAGSLLTVCQSASPAAITLVGAAVSGGATTGAWTILSGGGSLSTEGQTADPSTVTYTPAPNYSGEVKLLLTTNAGGSCTPATVERTINVSPPPMADAGPALTTCEGAGAVNIAIGSSAANYTRVSWETSGTGTFFDNTSLTAATYTPSLADIAAGSVTITLRANGGGCSDALSSRTLTITKAATANAGPEIVVCAGLGAINIPGAVASNYSGILWTEDGTGTISNPTSLTGAIYIPGLNETGTVTLTLTVTGNSPCSDAVSTRSITINPNASILLTSAATTAAQTPCINTPITPITYAIGGGGTGATFSGLPSGVAGTFSNGVATISGIASVSGSFNYTVTTTGTCAQTTATGIIVISPVSVGGTLSPALFEACVGDAGTITLAGHTGSVIRWESSINGGASWVTIPNTTTSQPYIASQTTTYRAVIQSGVCSISYSTASVISVLVKFTPVTLATPATICAGESSVLSSTTSYPTFGIPASQGDFSNANPEGWRLDGDDNNKIPANRSNTKPDIWGETTPGKVFTGILYNGAGGKFAVVDGGLNSTLETPIFSLIAQNSSSFDFMHAYNLTTGATAIIEISTDGGATYLPENKLAEYNGTSSFGITGTNGLVQAASISLEKYLGLYNLRVRFRYVGLGTTGSSWALDNVSVPAPPPITYQWTSNPATVFADPTTGNVTVSPTVTTTYTLTTFLDGCAAGIASVTVTVNPLPTIIPAPATNGVVIACNSLIAQTVSLPYSSTNLLTPATYSITWTGAAAASFAPVVNAAIPTSAVTVAIPAGTPAGIYTGMISVRNAKGCSSVPVEFSIVINPLPTLASVTTPPVCNVTSSTTITVTLTGLLANSISTLDYNIGGGPVVTVNGINADASGNGILQVTVTAANHNQTLTITRISSSPAANAVSCSLNLNVNNSLVLSVFPGYVWTGLAGTASAPLNAWSLPANWLCGVPKDDDNVIIPQVGNGNYPRLDNRNFRSNHFDLLGNATIELDGNQLTLGNATTSKIKNEGSIIGSQQSELVIMGVLSQSLKFVQSSPIGTTNALLTFTLNSPGQTATLENSLWVYGNANPTAGVINSDGHLTMVSTASISSNITKIVAPRADVIGDVNVQSYITGDGIWLNRGTRSMSSPINDALTSGNKTYRQLKDSIVITGPGGVGKGFDQGGWAQPYAETISFYVESKPKGTYSYVPLADINDANTPGLGFFLYFRGSGGTYDQYSTKVNAPYSSPESVTANYRGPINKFDLSVVLHNSAHLDDANNGLNHVGNPYPSSINWTGVTRTADVLDYFSIVKPSGSQETYLNGVHNNGGGVIIQPGQGFYVRTTAEGGRITFTESSKSTTYPGRFLSAPEKIIMSSKGTVFSSPDEVKDSSIKLLRLNIQDGTNKDETTVVFKEGSSLAAGYEDAPYISSGQVTLTSMSSDNRNLAINFVPTIDKVEEIRLNINSTKGGNMTLNFTELPKLRGYEVFLKDSLFPDQLVKVKVDLAYNFKIDASKPETSGNKRLKLVFKKEVIKELILQEFIVKKRNAKVELSWTKIPSQNAVQFEPEHSTDGTTFLPLSVIRSQGARDGNEKYFFIDKSPDNGLNYYRIKQTDEDGSISISEVREIEYLEEDSIAKSITIYPNPATKEIAINVNHHLQEAIELKVFDLNGKNVMSFKFPVLAPLRVNISKLTPGIYILEINELKKNSLIGSARFIKL